MNDIPPPRRGLNAGLVIAIVIGIAATSGYFAQKRLGQPAAGTAAPTAAPPATARAPDQAAAAVEPARKVPEVLPAFELKDRDGTPRRLSDWKGRPLIVNFWATWCAPCRREIPLLNAVREARRAQKLEIVGIAVDFRDDVLAYVKERPIRYPLLIGEEDGLEALKSVGMTAAFPFTLFADRQQRIVALKVGELHEDELDLILDEVRSVDSGQRDLGAARDRIGEGLKDLATKRALRSAGEVEKTS